MILAAEHLLPSPGGVLLAVLVVALIAIEAGRLTRRIIRSVERVGESYIDIYRQQHREVMEALKGETQKALEDTRALVLEHTELERILRVLAERDEENQERREAADEVRAAGDRDRTVADEERAGNDETRAGLDEARAEADSARNA